MLPQESSTSIPLAEPHCYFPLVTPAGMYVQLDLAVGVGSLTRVANKSVSQSSAEDIFQLNDLF